MGELEDLIVKTVAIPSVPQVLTRLQQVIGDPSSSMIDAVRVLEEDPGLATRCLRIANSVVYGLRVPCSTLRHASSVLGMAKLRDLALQTCLVAQFAHLKKTRGFNIDSFWQHGALTAICARQIAKNTRRFRGPVAETAASCGLLHNIGRLAMLDAFRASYLDVIVPTGGYGADAIQAEIEAFGFDHAKVGGMLAEKWHLADETIEAARDHHQPIAAEPKLAHLIGFANVIAHAYLESGDHAISEILQSETAQKLGLKSEDTADVAREISNLAAGAVMLSA
ncbi:MAG: HDOD domain-containing protein [Planctomycetota bacterium]